MVPGLRIVVIVAIFVAAVSFAGSDSCPDISRLREYYQEEGYISLEFVQLIHSDIFETVDTLSGSVHAGFEGRFRLSMPDQILVSNGVLYWSYSAENQQVLIDSVAELGSWNPLTLLYDPEQVYRCENQSAAGDTIAFDMIAADSGIVPTEFTMVVERGTYRPERLVYFDDNDSRIEVNIEKFRRRDHLPDSLFEFHPGPGVEVIEMP